MSEERPTEVPAERAIELVAAGAWLLDVREQHEWDRGHIAAAHHLPMRELSARVHELPEDQPIYVICHAGLRSERVAEALSGAGFDASNVAGGMIAWVSAGGQVVTPGEPDSRV